MPLTEHQKHIQTILEDQRPIHAVWFEKGKGYQVGADCHSIVAYGEPGQAAVVPFFAVLDGREQVISRVPAQMVVVDYSV